MKPPKIEVVSFDLDGTLIDYTFIDYIWFDVIPKLYVRKHRVSLEEAVEKITREYDEIGESKIEWYQIDYWFKRFKLNNNWRKIMHDSKNKTKLYPEVLRTLNYLFGRYLLVVNSNSPREFMDLELEVTGIRHYFHRTFSSTSDFGQVKKSAEYYSRICNLMGVKPTRVLHVGDNWKFDFIVPKSIGIKTIFLDRKMKKARNHQIIYSLDELKEKLLIKSNDQR